MWEARITRRQFLGAAAALAGVATTGLFAALGRPGLKPTGSQSGDKGHWVPTCCFMCGGNTGILVRVEEGRAVKIEPNPDNPVGVCNVSTDFPAFKEKGAALCPKGNAGLMALYDPDRIKRPLKRTNPRKGRDEDPGWREIAWEQALDEITERLRGLREAGEAHTLLWFTEDATATDIQADFCALYGTPNFYMHSNLCDVSRKAVFKLVLGHDRPLADFVRARYILLFGWNPLSAMKWSHLPRVITAALERGARLVVVDPKLSTTAARAHRWVAIRPGTDGAMALAMAHTIIAEGLYDAEFVNQWTVGFEEYARYVRDKTPEWAEGITGVPAAVIREVARELATTKPAVVDFWSGPGQHSNAVQGGRAIALLAALTGNVDAPGTLVIPEKGGGAHPPLKKPKIDRPRFDGLEHYPFGHSSGVYTEVVNRLVDGDGPYPVKAAVVVAQNLVLSIPGTDRVVEALSRIPFTVVVDNYLSETALLADIVLPGTTYLERWEVVGQWVTWPVISLRQPVVPPIFGQIPEHDLVIELGRRLNLTDAEGRPYFADLTYDRYLDAMLRGSRARMGLEEFRRLPGATWVDPRGTRYHKYAEELPTEQLAGAVAVNGVLYRTDDEGRMQAVGVVVKGRPRVGFNTPSRKVEFFSAQLAARKDARGRPLSGLPEYQPRDWQPSPEYPLYLINWKEMSHTHSRTFNNPYLMALKNESELYINSATARRLGIRDGDRVWVESPYGKARAVAKVVEGIHPETVGLQHGFGHWGFGRVAKGRGIADGQFNRPVSDPVSGMALHKEVCVRVYRA